MAMNYILLRAVLQSAMEADESTNDGDKDAEIDHLQTLIADEDLKADRYRKENVRRRHNYIPFIVELLKILAKEGKLVPLVKEVNNLFC